MHRLSATASALLLAGALAAADLAGASLGKHVSGPKVSASDLQGKVVLFEYWGINCPPCLANIKHISEIAALAGPDQLVVIANQCQGPGRTATVWKQHGGTDHATVVDDGDLPRANVTGIPRCFLFDHTGKQVYDGSPSQLTAETVRRLVEAAPGPLVGTGTYKSCAGEAAALKAKGGSSVAPALRSLRGKAGGGNAEAASEATALLANVKAYADRQLTMITENRTADPQQAAAGLQRMIGLLAGDELGKPFETLRDELKKDKVFLNEVKAAESMQQIDAALARANLGSGTIPPNKRQAAQEIAAAIMQLIRNYPGTKASQQAEKLKEQLAKQASG